MQRRASFWLLFFHNLVKGDLDGGADKHQREARIVRVSLLDVLRREGDLINIVGEKA